MHFLFEYFNRFNGFNVSFLYILATIAIISGIFIVITKNPVVSVLFLILLFSNISGYLIFIGIVFIGLSYLLVYVGAVSILFLFILMLINIRVSELIGETNNNIPLAVIALLSFFMPISSILPNHKNKIDGSEIINKIETQISYVSSNNWDNNMVNISDITAIGNIMYTSYFIWLIITSIILLLAMVGSIVITIRQKEV